MARRSQGTVYRKTKKQSGRRVKAGFYRARYTDAHGDKQDHVLVLQNGTKVRNKSVAELELNRILKRVEREAAGVIDPIVEAASMPMRVVLARFIRHLPGKRAGMKYIEQAISYNKKIMERAGMTRLAEFNADRIDKALRAVADAGRSPRTVNAYRETSYALGEWTYKIARLLNQNPVAVISKRKTAGDIRKQRRALTVDEAYRLLGVAGPRRLYYATSLWTGLRVKEVRALQWRDLELDGDRPAIQLRAATTKARRADLIPLHRDLAGMLRDSKPAFAQPTDPVFQSVPALATFRGGWFGPAKSKYRTGDLDRAGIARVDDTGHSLDLHALKTTYTSWLAQFGVSDAARTALSRHASRGVTDRHYTDFRLMDLWAEIGKLPPIRTGAASTSVRATGTDDAGCESGRGVVARPVALTPVRQGVKLSATGRMERSEYHAVASAKPLQTGVSCPQRAVRGRSSVGRASGLQPEGRGFESLRLHRCSWPGIAVLSLARLLPFSRGGFFKSLRENGDCRLLQHPAKHGVLQKPRGPFGTPGKLGSLALTKRAKVELRAYPINPCGTGFQPVEHTGCKPVPHGLMG